MVRELGLERRETVRSLSAIISKKIKNLNLVREDQFKLTSGKAIVGVTGMLLVLR